MICTRSGKWFDLIELRIVVLWKLSHRSSHPAQCCICYAFSPQYFRNRNIACEKCNMQKKEAVGMMLVYCRVAHLSTAVWLCLRLKEGRVPGNRIVTSATASRFNRIAHMIWMAVAHLCAPAERLEALLTVRGKAQSVESMAWKCTRYARYASKVAVFAWGTRTNCRGVACVDRSDNERGLCTKSLL